MNKSIKYKNSKALSMLVFAIILVIFNILISVSASYYFNSIILKAYGFTSIVDLIIYILLYKASKKSINTPDLIYNFGFGKYENFAIIISALFLPIILIHTLSIGADFLLDGTNLTKANILILIPIIIIIISKIKEFAINNFYSNSNISIFKSIVTRKSTTLNIELLLVISIVFQYFAPLKSEFLTYIDLLTASALVIFLMYLPLKNLRNSLNQLLDKTLPDEILFDFLSVIIEHFELMCEYKSMRTRRSGDDIFVEIDIVMPSNISLDKVNQIENSIKQALNLKYPNAHPRIYAQSCVRNCIYKDNGNCPILKSGNKIKDNING